SSALGPGREVRDQALVLKQQPRLVQREVLRRDDRLLGREVVVGDARPVRAHRLAHSPQELGQPLFVALLDRLSRLLVEVVEALGDLVVDLELALAHQPHDHFSSTFCFSTCFPPAGSSAFILASSSSTWDCEATALSCRSRSVWSEVKSSSAPDVVSSSIADARACICSVLSLARWIARPVSAI